MEFGLDFDTPAWRTFALGFCRRRCPDLSEEELVEAAEHFLDYLKIVWKQHRRLEAEGKLDEFMTLVRRDPHGLRARLVQDLAALLAWRARTISADMSNVVEPRNR